MFDPKSAPIDWAAYRFRGTFALFDLACLLHRLDPRAVFDDAHHAIKRHGGAAAEVLNSPVAAAWMLHANPAMYFLPPVGDTLERLKRAAGSRLGLTVDAARARALAGMLGLPYPTELEREAPARAAEPVPGAVAELSEPQRRLAALRAGGGRVKWYSGKWAITGIGKLTTQEKAEGRARSDEKTIRGDLKEAAEAEKREGPRPSPSPFPT